ncbi:lipoate protein ligase C-terminal domain-containing protein [Mycoplasma sp. ATU-Cv-508]|uniref:lipoate protein ligase C-terminal domain-containing protein n=1 Tax=Mycoplasma sp. ATU-Cv-508 TaxID=2048001 RepID=UPI000FDF645C
MLLAEVLRDFPAMTPYELTEEDKHQIELLRTNKYATWAHNYGQNPQYELNNTLYVPGVGLVEVYLNVENGLISDLKFYGDFFRQKRHCLRGKSPPKNSLLTRRHFA